VPFAVRLAGILLEAVTPGSRPGGDTNDVITELAGTRLTHKNVFQSHARSVSPIRAADPYGLQPEIMALTAATAPASTTLAGSSFDPHGDAFLAPMSHLTTACNTNGSPLHDMDATNPYPNKP